MTQQHTHDCDKCTYLWSEKEYDLYYCNKSRETLIARYWDEWDYLSWMAFKDQYPLNIAYKKAVWMNLIKPTMKKIDKNIPIPEESKYKKTLMLLDSLNIWDSFEFDSRDEQKYIVALFPRMRLKWKDFKTKNTEWIRRCWRIK